jgi:glycosyltransferase involved in cell wall biosynthesis
LRRFAFRRATNVAISPAIADDLGVPASIIPNPYDERIFRRIPEVERTCDLVFVGRLVSDKGADVLLRALAELAGRGRVYHLTIVGDGPERSRLEDLARESGIVEQVNFAGVRRDEELARILNAHRIIVVPSRLPEPFGIVAIEGIACGCVAIGSERGGLADAIGPCGVTVPNGDSAALACVIERLAHSPGDLERLRTGAGEHLARHTAGAVADAYLAIFAGQLRKRESANVRARTRSQPTWNARAKT